jgi:acetylglutamate kinase
MLPLLQNSIKLTQLCFGWPCCLSVLVSCRFVGEVTRVDATLLRSLVNSGYIPVVATVATDENGQALNVNADTAAGEVGST